MSPKRKKAIEDLRESEEKFRSLVEQNSEGVVLLDEQGRIIEWNAAQERCSGIPRGEALGQPVWDIQFRLVPPERKIPAVYNALKEAELNLLQSRQSAMFQHPFEVSIHRPDGSQVLIQQTAFPIKTSSGFRVGSLIRDITERKQTEQALHETNQKLEAIVQASPLAIEALDRSVRLTLWSPAAERLFGWTAEEVIGKDLPIAPPEQIAEVRKQIQEELQGASRNGFEVERLRKDGSLVPVSMSTAPIRDAQGNVSGVMAIFADITARKQAERDLERQMIELEVLQAVALAGTQASNQDELIWRVTRVIQEKIYPDNFGVALLDGNSSRLIYHPSALTHSNTKGQPLPVTEGISGAVTRSGAARRVADVSLDPDYLEIDPATRSELCVPIILSNRVIGVINAESSRLDNFSAADERLLAAIAGTLATSIAKIRLYEQTEQQLRQLTALREIDQSILSSLDLERTLDVLLAKITSLLQVDAAVFLLYQPRLQKLVASAQQGLPAEPIWDSSLPLANTHAGRAALSGEMEYIPDLGEFDDGLTQRIRAIGASFTSYIAIPLKAKGELKGVFQLFQRTRLEPASDWWDFLHVLVNQAAIAIDNAQLFLEQQQTNQRLMEAYETTIDGWSRTLNLRDKETEGHSYRVTNLTLALARRMGISEADIPHIRRGAKLHDIGKMGIPDSILLKPSSLSGEEWAIMRQHPMYALDLLYPIDFLQPALEIPAYHHEKWDGSGYPMGIKGSEIPLSARIFAIIDVWDALTSDRPYRPAWSRAQAMEYIQAESGRQFDPEVVRQFLTLLENEPQ